MKNVLPRWSILVIYCFVHRCYLCCPSLTAGATPKPTNPPRLKRKDNPVRPPRSPLPPVTPLTKPPSKPPTPTPVSPPSLKPTNPPRSPTEKIGSPHRGPTRSPTDAFNYFVVQPLLKAIGTNNLGCPQAADDLRSVLSDATTYQAKAAMYVLSLLRSGKSLTNAQLVMYYALACLYYSTGGETWYSNSNWLSLTYDPCAGENKWFGLNVCIDGKVAFVVLRSNNLIGIVPCEIDLLSASHLSKAGNLSLLELSDNINLNTAGSAGAQWISELGTSMRYLNISFTMFGTSFPTNVGSKIPNVQFIGARSAGVTGDLSFLMGLDPYAVDMTSNLLHGSIPATLGNGLNLRFLALGNNQLTGKLPPELANIPFPANEYLGLALYGNRLTGSIPLSYNSIPFSFFLLFDNQVTGAVPSNSCNTVFSKIGVDCDASSGPPEVTCNDCPSQCCCTAADCASYV